MLPALLRWRRFSVIIGPANLRRDVGSGIVRSPSAQLRWRAGRSARWKERRENGSRRYIAHRAYSVEAKNGAQLGSEKLAG